MTPTAARAPLYLVSWRRLRTTKTLFWLLPLLAFLIQSFLWPRVASWREDEATVLWIGRHYGVLDFTVGLISSTRVPNPAGLLWVAKLISFAPNLYWSGVFLQLLHLGFLCAACWALARRVSPAVGLGLFLLIGCLFAYRSSCSEPFSQWLMLPTTLGCLFFFLWCFKEPSFKLFFVLLGLLWIPPALYIAGVLNSAIFALALAICLLSRRYRSALLSSDWKLPLALFSLWSVAQLLLIWKPYFSVVSLHDLRSVSSVAPGQRLERAALELLRVPVWLWSYACDPNFRPALYTDAQIVSPAWFPWLGRTAQWLFRLLLLVLIAAGFRARVWKEQALWPWIYWPLSLLVLALTCSPLLGGPCFSRGERPDIGFQWLCLVLLPIAVGLAATNVSKSLRVAAYGLLLSFFTVELVAGLVAFEAHDHYQGTALSEADVPVRQKMAVIDTIVSEARARDIDGDIPIQYVVGGGIWDWIGRFRSKTLEHYGSPYTLGRAYDYDLDRRYGITNALKGRHERVPAGGFWVNYRFEPPLRRPGKVFEREMGRLRVGFRPPPRPPKGSP